MAKNITLFDSILACLDNNPVPVMVVSELEYQIFRTRGDARNLENIVRALGLLEELSQVRHGGIQGSSGQTFYWSTVRCKPTKGVN